MPQRPNSPDPNARETSAWPFSDPPNVGVFTTRIVIAGEPICFACRDWEDCAWTFLPRRVTEQKDAMVVGLKEIYDRDQSIGALADLRAGWMASRSDRDSPWMRARNHPFPVFADDRFYLDISTEYERLHPETYTIPSKQLRENLVVGGFVKLIFRFAAEIAPRQNNECERMWVSVAEVDLDNYRYRGILDNDPLLHTEIACGHELWFHATHVFDYA